VSLVSLNFHNVTSAVAEIKRAESCQWLALRFENADGVRFELTLFSDDPEGLIEWLARSRDEMLCTKARASLGSAE
jgi:hypothetical protein